MGETPTDAPDRPDEPALERVHAFDGRQLVVPPEGWDVEVPPFGDERFRGLSHRMQYWALRAAQSSVLGLPRVLREGLVRLVAAAGRTFDRRHTRAAEDYIRTALPGASDAEVAELVREAWRHLLRVALVAEGVEKRVMGGRFGEHYDCYACPEALEVLDSDAGAFLVTAHVGYWEASCPALIGMGCTPGYAIGKAPRNDFVAREIQRVREAQGLRLIPRNGAMNAVPAAVRSGGSVGILLDHRPRQKPVIAPFFGRPAACDRSAGVLIRRVRAPLVFYGCYGAPGTDPVRDWRFEMRVPAVIQPEELAGVSPEEIVARVNAELERLILHRPSEVFWLHDRFRDAPESFPDDGGSDDLASESAKSGGPDETVGGTLSAETPPSA
ncbi:MAG: lysophospholipid acyltransferase family protein [Planctomycetota bacterium]